MPSARIVLPRLLHRQPYPPARLASPEYPFQMIFTDYCSIKGKTWLVIVDRFTGWLSVFYFSNDTSARKLVEVLWEYITTFGITFEPSSDSGPQYVSHEFTSFLSRWGYHIERVLNITPIITSELSLP